MIINLTTSKLSNQHKQELVNKSYYISGSLVHVNTEDYRLSLLKYKWDKSTSNNPPVPSLLRLGDRVEKIARPIARVLDRVLHTHITGCQGCKKRKEFLNKF